jgi:salicylate hydroxylase
MTIRIAIAGGGIAGLCLARGLLQYPQFEVHVYEQVLQHKDKGGSLALHANAIGAMELIDPAIKQAYFRKANSMLEDDEEEMATQVIMAEGKYTGQVIARLGRAKGRKTVARVDLIAGYQELVPKEIVHLGKRVEGIEQAEDSGGVVVRFADGSTATADCLIGADGIHSVTREYVLGRDHPAARPVNHERWYRVGAKLPMEVVERTLSTQFLGFVPILCGPNGVFNMTPIQYGKVMTIGVYQRAKTSGDVGKVPDPDDFLDYHPDCAKMVEVS